MGRPFSCGSPNQRSREAVPPAPSGAGVRRAAARCSCLLWSLRRGAAERARGKTRMQRPPANNGGHKAAAAVAPGTCSLRGAGGGRWPFSGKTCRNIIYASNSTRATAEEGGRGACTGLSSGRSQDRGLGQQRAGSPAPLPLQGRAGLREQRFPAAI